MDALANQYDQCDGFIYALLNIAKEQSAKPENRYYYYMISINYIIYVSSI